MTLAETPEECLERLRPHLDRAPTLPSLNARQDAYIRVINGVRIHLQFNQELVGPARDALVALRALAERGLEETNRAIGAANTLMLDQLEAA